MDCGKTACEGGKQVDLAEGSIQWGTVVLAMLNLRFSFYVNFIVVLKM